MQSRSNVNLDNILYNQADFNSPNLYMSSKLSSSLVQMLGISKKYTQKTDLYLHLDLQENKDILQSYQQGCHNQIKDLFVKFPAHVKHGRLTSKIWNFLLTPMGVLAPCAHA